MEKHIVKIKGITKITHDVLQIATTRPPQYFFMPGQATELSINQDGWEEETRPFTFTSLPDNDYIEFTIKTYPTHVGVTNQLLQLVVGDELILHDVWGDISYHGEGFFIAGGAGVTPFIAIFRHLQSINEVGNNKLIFANKTKADIILEEELTKILGSNFINILSDEETPEYAHGFITEAFIKAQMTEGFHHEITNLFYLCGPPPMMDAIEKQLLNLQVDEKSIIKEGF